MWWVLDFFDKKNIEDWKEGGSDGRMIPVYFISNYQLVPSTLLPWAEATFRFFASILLFSNLLPTVYAS
jgi:hypothetical protein